MLLMLRVFFPFPSKIYAKKEVKKGKNPSVCMNAAAYLQINTFFPVENVKICPSSYHANASKRINFSLFEAPRC